MASPTKKIMNTPMHLIKTEKRADGKHYPAVDNEVLKKVAQVQKKIVFVPVIGMYRTGKTYLINRIIRKARKTSGQHELFSVGHTSEPETKGVWIYIVDHPNLPDHKLALLDTEGIGDTEKGDQQHDAMLFMLMCLVSNILIHNGMRTIDEGSLEHFHFLAEMSKYVVMKANQSENDKENINHNFPELVYLVRDCQNILEKNGKPITPNEYLENGLAVGADEDQTTERAKTRRAIKESFKHRKCFTFDLPTNSREKNNTLDKIADKDLNKDFVDEVNELCAYIFKDAKAGVMLNGHQFAKLLETYVSMYRNGKIPNASSTMGMLKTQENKKALEKAETMYDSTMKKFDNTTPVMSGTILKEHREILKEIKSNIVKEAILEKSEVDGFLKTLEDKLIEKRDKIVDRNDVKLKHVEEVRYLEKKADVVGAMERVALGTLNAISEVACVATHLAAGAIQVAGPRIASDTIPTYNNMPASRAEPVGHAQPVLYPPTIHELSQRQDTGMHVPNIPRFLSDNYGVQSFQSIYGKK